jgi:hypothetical protein
MRVVCEVVTPKADSYGRTDMASFVTPFVDFQDVPKKMAEIIDFYQHFKPGMKFNFTFEEDWDEN